MGLTTRVSEFQYVKIQVRTNGVNFKENVDGSQTI